jgi:hypothetical protein
MEAQPPQDLAEKRRLIGRLLSPADPNDALASYYALCHDSRRTRLTLHWSARQQVDGYLAVSQTGADLFRPLVTLRAPDEETAGELIRSGLAPHRMYRIVVPPALAAAVRTHLDVTQPSVSRIYRLDPSRFEPIVNVLVQRTDGPDGSLRFQIESHGQIVAMSGTNWRSPSFAEVFVYVHLVARGRGFGRSVVSACSAALLAERVRPLYMVHQDNTDSLRIAEALGYVDTGAEEFGAEVQRAG